MSHFRQQFEKKVAENKSRLRRFLTRLEKDPPLLLDTYAEQIDKEVWEETNCLACSNCCRTMTPTYTMEDIHRIATHFRMSPSSFKEKWLYKNKNGDWMNRLQPCQFLDFTTNMCSIYKIRPADCVGFPHLTKKKMLEYLHVHKQNIKFCPATYLMVEKMIRAVNEREITEIE
ncbi:MAG TPA: YkgJ family cysteine cluster protein [Chitinophagaceae bacterium]|nr:YkgJ family cysteine cluster protein [Chitinophagaceae bacterium]